jgi:hypothetical protein
MEIGYGPKLVLCVVLFRFALVLDGWNSAATKELGVR